MNKIRIMLADDHEVVREGLSAILGRRDEFIVVAEVGDGEAAVEAWINIKPDIGLLDLRMPKMEGVEAIKRIRTLDANAKLIILTTYDGDEDIYQGLRAGAKGYLLKDTPREHIIDAIHSVIAGRTYIPSQVGEKLASRINVDTLTDKEQQILKQIADGLSNKQIAKILSISEGTVKFHSNSIYTKLGVTSRTEAVKVATARGLLR
jgi:two-component system, NarL family, response regulator